MVVLMMVARYDLCLNFICVNLGECTHDDDRNFCIRMMTCRYCLTCSESLSRAPWTLKGITALFLLLLQATFVAYNWLILSPQPDGLFLCLQTSQLTCYFFYIILIPLAFRCKWVDLTERRHEIIMTEDQRIDIAVYGRPWENQGDLPFSRSSSVDTTWLNERTISYKEFQTLRTALNSESAAQDHCAICLECYQESDPLIEFDCHHIFHK